MARVDVKALRRLVDAPLSALLEVEVLDRVRDIDVFAVDAGSLERLVQLAPGRAHEWAPLAIFAVARHLAYEHHAGLLQPLAEDSLGRPPPQRTAATLAGCFTQARERLALGQERRRVVGLAPAQVLGRGHAICSASSSDGRSVPWTAVPGCCLRPPSPRPPASTPS